MKRILDYLAALVRKYLLAPRYPRLIQQPVGSFDDASGEWRLLSDWGVDTRAGRLTVRAGFLSDGASIPRWLWSLVGPRFDCKTFPCALAHDALYAAELPCPGAWRRDVADAIFRDLLKEHGVSVVKREAYWAAVRLFGGVTLPGHTAETVAEARKLVELEP